MATAAQSLSEAELRVEESLGESPAEATERRPSSVLLPWVRAQSINITRHAAALRPFKREEFGQGVALPSEGHIQAVNRLISALRASLFKLSGHVRKAAVAAIEQPSSARLQQMVIRKDRGHNWV